MSSEEMVAVKLAQYVLDKEVDPDADICILARQFLRKWETTRSLVHASGGRIFVPDTSVMDGNDDRYDLVFSRNVADKGCDVYLRKR